MPGKIDGLNPPFVPIGGIRGLPSQPPIPAGKSSDFHDLLLEKLAGDKIKFSAHAQSRLESRGIPLDAQRIEKLVDALDKAQMKGAHDSLVLMDDVAFIVNVDNRTVITAMDEESMSENVFTNIDSAIIIK